MDRIGSKPLARRRRRQSRTRPTNPPRLRPLNIDQNMTNSQAVANNTRGRPAGRPIDLSSARAPNPHFCLLRLEGNESGPKEWERFGRKSLLMLLASRTREHLAERNDCKIIACRTRAHSLTLGDNCLRGSGAHVTPRVVRILISLTRSRKCVQSPCRSRKKGARRQRVDQRRGVGIGAPREREGKSGVRNCLGLSGGGPLKDWPSLSCPLSHSLASTSSSLAPPIETQASRAIFHQFYGLAAGLAGGPIAAQF